MWLNRLELQIGKNNINKLRDTTILIVGLGGVGGYATESLARSGIGHIIIVDYDKIDITNINRQIIANTNNIGEYKTTEFKKRILEINPDCIVDVINERVTPDNINMLFSNNIDYIVDACDTFDTKMALIYESINRKIKLISSMGTGNKLDPSKLKIMDIRKTSYDPIAKKIRKRLKDERINNKIMVVCSTETPIKTESKIISSNSFVPATAGLLIASYIINEIIKA